MDISVQPLAAAAIIMMEVSCTQWVGSVFCVLQKRRRSPLQTVFQFQAPSNYWWSNAKGDTSRCEAAVGSLFLVCKSQTHSPAVSWSLLDSEFGNECFLDFVLFILDVRSSHWREYFIGLVIGHSKRKSVTSKPNSAMCYFISVTYQFAHCLGDTTIYSTIAGFFNTWFYI